MNLILLKKEGKLFFILFKKYCENNFLNSSPEDKPNFIFSVILTFVNSGSISFVSISYMLFLSFEFSSKINKSSYLFKFTSFTFKLK